MSDTRAPASMSSAVPAPRIEQARWYDAQLAAGLFLVDPAALGGIVVRSQFGPVREAWLAHLKSMAGSDAKMRRVPLDVSEGRLLGGMDLAATLHRGLPVAERGLLAEADGGILVLPSAERADTTVLTAIAGVLDLGRVHVERDGIAAVDRASFGVIALDESCGDDEAVGNVLRDRLAIAIDLDGLAMRDVSRAGFGHDSLERARRRLAVVEASDQQIEALCAMAMALGVASLRAPLQALRVARTAAAFFGRDEVATEDLETAIRLVLAPRATQIPALPEDDDDQPAPPDDAPQPEPQDDAGQNERSLDELEELLLEAAKAALPPGLLEHLRAGAAMRKAKSSVGKAGVLRAAKAQRGRRAGSRRGDPRSGGRLALLETVRAAAPWQRLRRMERAQRGGDLSAAPRLEVRRDDFRLRRFKHQAETATIFVVDASGSAALHRLAEAKGAVELLLADCYARRDHVALIAFRGKTADVLLPPTRSLVRAKKSLAGLPGGGGTPLATATDQACLLGKAAQRKGQTPTLVFLTDGRANISRAGVAGRAAAEADAHTAARSLKAEGLPAIVIDTSPRAGKDSQRFAELMGATYLPLPHADATSLSKVIRQVSA